MSEVAQAFAWIVSVAQADSALMAVATGGVWEQVADIGVTAPYMLIVQQSGVDVNTANGIRVFARLLMQIKMVGPTSNYAALVTGADRIDTLFKSVRQTALPSGSVLECVREQPLSYPDTFNNIPYAHLGGLYGIDLQGS